MLRVDGVRGLAGWYVRILMLGTVQLSMNEVYMGGVAQMETNGNKNSFSFRGMLTRDVLRVGILLLVVGTVLVIHDNTNIVVVQALGIGLFLVGGSHLTRRILFHRIDLQSIALRAVEEKNAPAAIVFAVIVAFLVAIMHLSMSVLK